jgi:hypothetical protein
MKPGGKESGDRAGAQPETAKELESEHWPGGPHPHAGHLLLGLAGARDHSCSPCLMGAGATRGQHIWAVTSCLLGPLRSSPAAGAGLGFQASVGWGQVTLARWAGQHGFLLWTSIHLWTTGHQKTWIRGQVGPSAWMQRAPGLGGQGLPSLLKTGVQ